MIHTIRTSLAAALLAGMPALVVAEATVTDAPGPQILPVSTTTAVPVPRPTIEALEATLSLPAHTPPSPLGEVSTGGAAGLTEDPLASPAAAPSGLLPAAERAVRAASPLSDDPSTLTQAASHLTLEAVNTASFREDESSPDDPDPVIMKLQILLDRQRLSPGVIDGLDGGNLRKALRLFEAEHMVRVDGQLDEEVWNLLGGDTADPVLVRYTISEQDVATAFSEAIPQDFGLMAQMDRLAYTSPLEMFAERFHMAEKALATLNPGVDLSKAGNEIIVAAVGSRVKTKVARLVADKRIGQVRAYDADERLVAAYPATIGSTANPSPSGTHEVTGVAIDPVYYYDPQRNFQQGENTQKLQLPPGPNNPVGSVWIALSKPTYGIHGTPEPSKIGKTASRGCIRLTNWDAQELARLVSPGATVTFLEEPEAVGSSTEARSSFAER